MMEESVSAQNQNTPQASSNTLLKILALVGVLFMVAGSAYAGYWYGKSQTEETEPVTTQPVTNEPSTAPQNMEASEMADWKTFYTKAEGFAVRYPKDWSVRYAEDHENDSSSLEAYNIISPDGIRVYYHEHKQNVTDDRWGCGGDSICQPDVVDSLETLEIPGLGQGYLVGLSPHNYKKYVRYVLHKPLSIETTPKIGSTLHDKFAIHYSLPSKTGARYVLQVMADDNNKLWNPTSDQARSIEKAVAIIKSLTYEVPEADKKQEAGKNLIYQSKEYGFSFEYPEIAYFKESAFAPIDPDYPGGTWGVEKKISLSVPGIFLGVNVHRNNTSLGLVDWLKDGYLEPINQPYTMSTGLPYKIAGEQALAIFFPSAPFDSGHINMFFQRGQIVFELRYHSISDSLATSDFAAFKAFLSSFDFDDTKNIPDILPQESDFR